MANNLHTKSKLLFDAIDKHDVDLVRTLIEEGVPIDDALAEGPKWRPLEAAIEELQTGGSLDIVKLLVEAGADVNSRDVDGSLPPLHCAVFANEKVATELLLSYGADPNVVTNEGETPLKHAAEKGQLEVAEMLLDNQADRSIDYSGGPCGMNALALAVRNLDAEMVKLLVSRGADPELEDADGRSAKAFLPRRVETNSEAWKSTVAALYKTRRKV